MPALTEDLLQERLGALEHLGFSIDEALQLAEAVDSTGALVPIHSIRKAIARDCSLELALAIFT